MGRSLFSCLVLAAMLGLAVASKAQKKVKRDDLASIPSTDHEEVEEQPEEVPEGVYEEIESCQCGVFMSQQVGIKAGRRSRPRGPPEGEPVVTYDTESPTYPCGAGGVKHCISKCLDVILKYLPRAGPVICGAVERDVHREKAFLFIRNCGSDWFATNFSAGKEFCCTDGQHHKC